jgi:hypothetical protein
VDIRIPADFEPHARTIMAWAVHREWGADRERGERERGGVIRRRQGGDASDAAGATHRTDGCGQAGRLTCFVGPISRAIIRRSSPSTIH